MKKYEYITSKFDHSLIELDQRLSAWGEKGWELVEVIEKQEAETNAYYIFVFKRELA